MMSPFFLKNEKAEKEPSSLRKESSSTSSSSLSHLEPNCKKNMNLDEAKLLTMDAVLSGIENDLASGGGIDSCIITANGMELVVAPAAKSSKKLGTYTFPVGTTPILGETIVRELDPDEIMSTFGSC